MNIWRLTLFLLLLNGAIYIVGVANIPIKCNSVGTSCLYFGNDIIGTTTLSDIMTDNIDEGQYKSVQIETDITTDIYTTITVGLANAGKTLIFSIYSIYAIIVFIFGRSAVAIAIATVMQTTIYYFYGRAFISMIREGKGDM